MKSSMTWALGILDWLAANEWNLIGGWVEAFTASDGATGDLEPSP